MTDKTQEELDKILDKILADLVEGVSLMAVNDKFTPEEFSKKCIEGEEIAKNDILIWHEEQSKLMSLEWRIEQWRTARKYMLEDVWQPIYDELLKLRAEQREKLKSIRREKR